MTIGIIGAGALGSNIARAFARFGIAAILSNSRGPQTPGKAQSGAGLNFDSADDMQSELAAMATEINNDSD